MTVNKTKKSKDLTSLKMVTSYLCLSCPSAPFAVQGGGFEPRFKE